MDKIKAFLIKYKLYVAIGAVGLIAIYLLRNSGGSNSVSTNYTTATSQGNIAADPTVTLAQMQQQGALAQLTADYKGQYDLANLALEGQKYQISQESALALATIDANKWVANLDANTQMNVAQLGYNATKYQSDAQIQIQGLNNQMSMYELDATKFITDRQLQVQQSIAGMQASIEKKKISAEKTNSFLNFGGSLLNFFGNKSGSNNSLGGGYKFV